MKKPHTVTFNKDKELHIKHNKLLLMSIFWPAQQNNHDMSEMFTQQVAFFQLLMTYSDIQIKSIYTGHSLFNFCLLSPAIYRYIEIRKTVQISYLFTCHCVHI